MKELSCNFDYDNQYVKLERRQIKISEEGIVKMFKLPCGGLMARARKGYNGVVATYFTKTQQDHYVFKSRYVIAQANGKARVGRLEALTKILTFCQGNRFVLCSLISMMLTTEKELIN
jgi:hypothetical protein